jgi:DNA (cytosine-5)-methyltransferase 1
MVTAVRTNAGGSVMVQGDCAESLATFTDPTSQFIAYGFQPRIARNGRGDMGDVANALNAQSGETGKGDAAPCVAIGHPAPVTYQWRVRRLTEIECERLQGYPDNHTLVKHNGKWLASGPRYKAIGNSKAVPVVLWIGRQIEAAVGKTISASWSDAFFT